MNSEAGQRYIPREKEGMGLLSGEEECHKSDALGRDPHPERSVGLLGGESIVQR